MVTAEHDQGHSTEVPVYGALVDEEWHEVGFAKASSLQKQGPYTVVKRSDVHRGANIIGCHVIYRRKVGGSAMARVVL